MTSPNRAIREFLSFILVGITNTLLGYAIILGTMYWLKMSPVKSNMLGYAILLMVSFFLNKYYVFKRRSRILKELALFLFSFILSYLLNLGALKLALMVLNPYLSQVAAGIIYTASSFLLCKFLVFGNRRI